VFANGFSPVGDHNDPLLHTSSNTTRGNFVSTTSNINIAEGFATAGGSRSTGYVYVIETDNYVNINQTYGSSAYFTEQYEYSVPGGVSPEEVYGAYWVENGSITGDIILNPNFGG